ncbi:unnamed protein product [Penicillium salamii]|uniref:Uncharacterized protein n=1 Tax=Penicillium salamii TaxID=1612424 RepID=A0A9W4JT64_9EURO|nr:unnamed protein product [Penicillium salamii]CAG8029643.1 unnamed protein product [Penicillium salamii]CAG8064640.1 unnamed protein product [Penicillium salamii]CAG8309104.1 unnamed protein product [Penicillium salamii]CAG8316007.1 unnamed protein product [Penicillium salamii]
MAVNATTHAVTTYEDLETAYVRMIVEADEIAWEYNIIASSANWVLLAGYLVVPGTFTSLQRSSALNNSLSHNTAGDAILSTIQNPPLLAIACILFVLGTTTMGWLFRAHRINYIWLINRLFIPTLLNAFAGLLTIIINICTARHGDVSIMALLAIITTGLSATSSFALTIMYKKKLKRLREEHYSHRVPRRINPTS